MAAVGVGVVALGAAGILASSYAHAVSILYEPRSHVTAEQRALAFSEIRGLEDAELTTSDGLTLRGWYAAGTNRAAVVLTHGGSANRAQLYPEAKLFASHGYGVLFYDSRACGESDGDLHTRGDREQRDVAAALDYLSKRPEVDRQRIALLGFSIGSSSVALEAAADPRARAVILCAVWTSLEDEIRHSLGKYGPLSWGPTFFAFRLYGLDIDNVRPIDRIAAIKSRPLLFVSGTRDTDTPLAITERVFDAAGQPKELWVVQGAGHGGYLESHAAEYESHVVGFLDRALGTTGASRPQAK